MTARTRRRLTLCLVLGLMTLPAEAMLFPVALTPDAGVAAVDWAEGLSDGELAAAAAVIDRYPVPYRRAVIGALEPEQRSTTWRAQFAKYMESHPALTPEQVQVLQDAMTVATPEAFAPPMSADVRARVEEVFNRSLKVLGTEATGELFVTLGPKVVKGKSALPFTERVADRLRSWRVVNAQYPDCNCNVEMDTCDMVPDPWLQCSELYTCNFDLSWPMCGPFWSWACTGWCKLIRFPYDE